MSHLAHINTFKVALINAGVTSPEDQTELVRSAYTLALVRVIHGKCIPIEDRRDFLCHVLSYWNETFPVEGNLVIHRVMQFFQELDTRLNTLNGNLYVPLIHSDLLTKCPTFSEMDGYGSLVNCLFEEASRKYVKG